MLDQLVERFPDVRFEISNGKKRLAKVSVEYQIVGSIGGVVKFLKELESEWPFAAQHYKKTVVHIEYLVKADEIEEFVKRVSYRGKRIVVGF